MGVGIDPVNNIIYSAGEDKTLKVTNISDHKVIFGIINDSIIIIIIIIIILFHAIALNNYIF